MAYSNLHGLISCLSRAKNARPLRHSQYLNEFDFYHLYAKSDWSKYWRSSVSETNKTFAC